MNTVLAGIGSNVSVLRGGGPVTFVKGRAVQPAQTTVTILASIQPATPNDLKQLPELERTEEIIKVFSADPLYTANEEAQTPADIIIWQGKHYRVFGPMPYQQSILDHYETLAKKVKHV